MPQQLIYTSAPRGITSGRSGYCTVARSAEMRESLVLQLEQISYYQHRSLTGGIERPIHAFRILDVRNSQFFVLSRIQDAGLDFTKRTNFLAQHLVFTPEETPLFASPPLLFRHWKGWEHAWEGDPELFEDKEEKYWESLLAIQSFEADPEQSYETAPASGWKELTGAGVNAFGLLDIPETAWLDVRGCEGDTILRLLAESLRMMEVRYKSSGYHLKAWQCSFTTNFQEQDNPSDFKWRCVHSESLGGKVIPSGAVVVPLRGVRSPSHIEEEMAFAETGPKPAAIEGQSSVQISIEEGESLTLNITTSGIPYPAVEWLLQGKQLSGNDDKKRVIRNLQPENNFICEVRAHNAYGKSIKTWIIAVKPAIGVGAAESPDSKQDQEASLEANTAWLASKVLESSKNTSTTTVLWERVRKLNDAKKHPSLRNVPMESLSQLLAFCQQQKPGPDNDQLRTRCSEALKYLKRDKWWRIGKQVAKWLLLIGAVAVVLLLVWKLYQKVIQSSKSTKDQTPLQIEKANQSSPK